MKIKIKIPEDVSISDLRMSRSKTGIQFRWEPIEKICQASGVDVDLFKKQTEENVCGLIIEWYTLHLSVGGDRDPVIDDLTRETVLEGLYGVGVSHEGGSA